MVKPCRLSAWTFPNISTSWQLTIKRRNWKSEIKTKSRIRTGSMKQSMEAASMFLIGRWVNVIWFHLVHHTWHIGIRFHLELAGWRGSSPGGVGRWRFTPASSSSLASLSLFSLLLDFFDFGIKGDLTNTNYTKYKNEVIAGRNTAQTFSGSPPTQITT